MARASSSTSFFARILPRLVVLSPVQALPMAGKTNDSKLANGTPESPIVGAIRWGGSYHTSAVVEAVEETLEQEVCYVAQAGTNGGGAAAPHVSKREFSHLIHPAHNHL